MADLARFRPSDLRQLPYSEEVPPSKDAPPSGFRSSELKRLPYDPSAPSEVRQLPYSEKSDQSMITPVSTRPATDLQMTPLQASAAELQKSPNLYGLAGIATAPFRPIESLRTAGRYWGDVAKGAVETAATQGNAFGFSDYAASSINQQGGFMPVSQKAQQELGVKPNAVLTNEQLLAVAPPSPGFRQTVTPEEPPLRSDWRTPGPWGGIPSTPAPTTQPAPVTSGGTGSIRAGGVTYTAPTGDLSQRGAYGESNVLTGGNRTGGTLNITQSPESILTERNKERAARGEEQIDVYGRVVGKFRPALAGKTVFAPAYNAVYGSVAEQRKAFDAANAPPDQMKQINLEKAQIELENLKRKPSGEKVVSAFKPAGVDVLGNATPGQFTYGDQTFITQPEDQAYLTGEMQAGYQKILANASAAGLAPPDFLDPEVQKVLLNQSVNKWIKRKAATPAEGI